MPDSNNMFAKVLKEEREKRNMTLEEMAELLGTKKQVLSRYERGERNPKLITAALFAQRLNIPIEAFQNDIDLPMELKGSRQLNKEEQEYVKLLNIVKKHADAIELLDQVPEDQYGLVLKVLRSIATQEETK